LHGGAAALNVSGAATYQWMENGVTYNTNGKSITVMPAQTFVIQDKRNRYVWAAWVTIR